jgi:hypothetical protein
MAFWDKLGDLVDGVSGRTDANNLQRQLENQQQLNEHIVALQQQEIAYKESPAYLAARQKRIYLAALMLVAGICAAIYFYRKG